MTRLAASLGPLFVTMIVYASSPPTCTVAVDDFVIARSALVVTFVVALAVSGDRESVVESSVMSFVTLDGGVEEAGVTCNVMLVVPTGISLIVHVTVPLAPAAGVAQLQPGAVMLVKSIDGGRTSVSVRSPADDGPESVMPIV
jgi:hypothetical protein